MAVFELKNFFFGICRILADKFGEEIMLKFKEYLYSMKIYIVKIEICILILEKEEILVFEIYFIYLK